MQQRIEVLDATGGAGETQVQEEEGAGFYAWYALTVLMLCYILGFIDNKIVFILIEQIKADLHLSDTQIGLVTGPVFSITYAICSIPIARLSDRFSRKYVMSAAIAVWSLFTSACGMVQSYGQMIVGRMGVAVGESACTPAAHSLITDFFPVSKRGRALSIYSTGAILGGFLALAGGGYLGDRYGWRTTLMIVGGTGVVLMFLVLFTLKEPVRQGAASGKKEKRSFRTGFAMLRTPGFSQLLIAGALLGMSLGSLSAWVPTFIIRSYGLSATEAGASFGAATVGLGLVGTLLGGAINDWLGKRDTRYGLWLLAGALVIAGVCKFAALMMTSYSLFLVLMSFSSLMIMFYPGPTFATVQALAHPDHRSLAAAFILFSISGFGIATGSLITGVASDLLATSLGEDSLRWALVIVAFPSLFASYFYWAAARHLKPAPPV